MLQGQGECMAQWVTVAKSVLEQLDIFFRQHKTASPPPSVRPLQRSVRRFWPFHCVARAGAWNWLFMQTGKQLAPSVLHISSAPRQPAALVFHSFELKSKTSTWRFYEFRQQQREKESGRERKQRCCTSNKTQLVVFQGGNGKQWLGKKMELWNPNRINLSALQRRRIGSDSYKVILKLLLTNKLF